MSHYLKRVIKHVRVPFNATQIAQQFIDQIATACDDWQAEDEERKANGEDTWGPFDHRENIEARGSDIETYLDIHLSRKQYDKVQDELTRLLDEKYPIVETDA